MASPGRGAPTGGGESPTVRDRAVQKATKPVIEPIVEADLLERSDGFRPRRRAVDALEAVRKAWIEGRNWVIDADGSAHFDTLDQGVVLERVAQRISDRRVVTLVRQWSSAG